MISSDSVQCTLTILINCIKSLFFIWRGHSFSYFLQCFCWCSFLRCDNVFIGENLELFIKYFLLIYKIFISFNRSYSICNNAIIALTLLQRWYLGMDLFVLQADEFQRRYKSDIAYGRYPAKIILIKSIRYKSAQLKA